MTTIALALLVPWAAGIALIVLDGRRRFVGWAAVVAGVATAILVLALAREVLTAGTIGFTTGIHERYHLPADEARALDPEKITAIARTVFVSIWALADAAERPGIDKPIPPNVPRYGAAR